MIKKIKNILKIIISILIISMIIKSCAKAWTWNDLIDFNNNIVVPQTQSYDSYRYRGSRTFGANWAEWTQQMNEIDSPENYSSFLILSRYNGGSLGSSYIYIYLINNVSNYSITSSQLSLTGSIRKYEWRLDRTERIDYNTTMTSLTTDFNYSRYWGIIDGQTISNYYDWFLENKYCSAVPRGETINYENSNEFKICFDSIIGKNYSINDINYKVYTLIDNVKTYYQGQINTLYSDINNGKAGQISLNGDYLIEGQNYFIEIYENETYLNESSKGIYVTKNRDTSNDSPIYNNSGDNTGSIDLTNTNNKIDEVKNEIINVNNQITSGNTKIVQSLNEIESGNKERQTFWESAYNNLFTISGDYIENKIEEIKESFNISGDYEEEKAFIDLIKEQSGDFIISWNNFTPHFSIKGQQIDNVQMISGDSINFSKLERENEDLHNVMIWERTLVGFALGVLLIKNYWKTLLHTLGIGVQVYENSKEETGTITQTITYDKKGNKKRVETYKKGNITIRKEK